MNKEDSPAKRFGGTWERFAQGRTVIGVDETDEDFKRADKVGGHKTMRLKAGTGWGALHAALTTYGNGFDAIDDPAVETGWIGNTHVNASGCDEGTTTGHSYGIKILGETEAGDNLPPYICVYMWKKIE